MKRQKQEIRYTFVDPNTAEETRKLLKQAIVRKLLLIRAEEQRKTD